MAFVNLRTAGGADIRRRRFLIGGEPNSRKTSALLSLLPVIQKADPEAKLAILSYPGEKGYDTIPVDRDDIVPLIWREEPDKKGQDSATIVKMVYDTSIDVIGGKMGNVKAFCGDGLHKFFDYVLDSVTGGAYMGGDEFEPKLYAVAHRWFTDYLNRIMHSGMPIVAFTTWTEYEADRQKKQGEKASDIPSHIYPALPGKMAKKIMGEFSAVFHQSLKSPKPGDDPIGCWQTRPYGEVWGAGIKGPEAIVKLIPTFIAADYGEFERLWDAAAKKVATDAPVTK